MSQSDKGHGWCFGPVRLRVPKVTEMGDASLCGWDGVTAVILGFRIACSTSPANKAVVMIARKRKASGTRMATRMKHEHLRLLQISASLSLNLHTGAHPRFQPHTQHSHSSEEAHLSLGIKTRKPLAHNSSTCPEKAQLQRIYILVCS